MSLSRILTQKQQEFIVSLSREIKTQDNLATASPYVIVNTQKIEQIRPVGYADDYYLLIDDETKIYTKEDLYEYMRDYDYWNLEEWCQDNLGELEDITGLDTEEVPEYENFIQNNEIEVIHYEEVEEISKNNLNVFFTHKAFQEHIEANKHHYNQPKSWLKGLFRNPEMEGVLDVIHSLAHAIELEREELCVYEPYEYTNKLYITGCDHTLVNPAYSTIWDFCPSCGKKIHLKEEQK